MKKLFCFLAWIATFGLINIPSYAAESPSYDSTYNNNQGAFFANGTPIIISEVDGNTTITWDGGSQIVPNTVSVFGGGQGYSYTGTVNLTISDGDMSNSYVTAGGSNGYTGTANVKLTGGKIGVYQSVNRGTLDNATVRVTGSTIGKFYVGGETEDKSVTGVINKINSHLVSGTIESLDVGTSNGSTITIDNENYNVTATDSVKITNDNIGDSKKSISYDFTVSTKTVKLFVNQNMKISTVVTTEPSGYEDVFTDLFYYSVDDEAIATVSEDGIITGVSEGNTSVTVKNGDKTQIVDVTVTDVQPMIIFLSVLVVFVAILLAVLFAFLYLEVL